MTIQRDWSTGLAAGSTGIAFIGYNGTTKSAGKFYGGTTAPSNTTRLNYDGNLYATTFYGSGAGLTGTTVPIASINASGTPSSTTFLRGDGQWIGAGFPSGTLMLFAQTTAPTGWTKSTTHNDKALRVVSGTASSGGSVAFSTVFGKTATDSTTLTAAQSGLPSHTHNLSTYASGVTSVTGIMLNTGDQNSSINSTSAYTSSTGGSSASSGHTHGMDIRVQYVDVIIASKDA